MANSLLYGRLLKRVLDILLSVSGIFVFSPVWIIFSLAIRLEDKGRIYYLQDRAGKDGKIFRGIKFRSMIPDAERYTGPVQAKENDPRVTKIGRLLRKTAMDELPQLLNILKGDMSFVGPRPLRPLEIESGGADTIKTVFDVKGFKDRSAILPGLTGAAQVFASRNLPRGKKFRYDLWYVKNLSFCLDIKLIFKSFVRTFSVKWDI